MFSRKICATYKSADSPQRSLQVGDTVRHKVPHKDKLYKLGVISELNTKQDTAGVMFMGAGITIRVPVSDLVLVEAARAGNAELVPVTTPRRINVSDALDGAKRTQVTVPEVLKRGHEAGAEQAARSGYALASDASPEQQDTDVNKGDGDRPNEDTFLDGVLVLGKRTRARAMTIAPSLTDEQPTLPLPPRR